MDHGLEILLRWHNKFINFNGIGFSKEIGKPKIGLLFE